MSFINDLAFGEKLDELEIEGDLKVGGDILLQGAFPKMDQKIFDLNTTIGYKANQSDVDEMEVTLNTKANQADVDASLSLKANQADTDLAFSLTDGQIDAVNALLGIKANQVDMENAAALISVLDTDLSDNAHRINTLETDVETLHGNIETISSNVEILHGNVETLSSNIVILHGNVETIESNISILHGNVETLSSNIEILHGNVETLSSNIVILHWNVETIESNISILHGNVETLSSNIEILHGNVETLSSNIVILHGNVETLSSNIVILHGNVETLSGNVNILHGNVETLTSNIEILRANVVVLTDDLESNAVRIQALYNADYAPKSWVNDKDYATEAFVTGAVVSANAIGVLIDLALTGYASTTSLGTTNQSVADLADLVADDYVAKPSNWTALVGALGSLDDYVATKISTSTTIVFRPTDWSTYPPSLGAATTLKSYTEKKIDVYIDALVDGGSEYLKLRNDSVDGSGNRIGTQKIEFLRTTAAEAFGANQCADWKIGTDSTCGLNIYRKGTHPTLGVLYNGNVIEFDQDGDVNVVKVGGLKINNAEVATKSYTDATFAAIGVEASVSQLATTSTDHGRRITTIEGAGYATTSQLSVYATASSLGTRTLRSVV